MFADAMRRSGVPAELYFIAGGPAGWRVYRRLAKPNVGAEAEASTAIAASESSPFLYPDHSLEEALQIMRDWPVLPIISRADPQILEGVLAHADILTAYREAGSIDPS
jgi:hypothetical protein